MNVKIFIIDKPEDDFVSEELTNELIYNIKAYNIIMEFIRINKFNKFKEFNIEDNFYYVFMKESERFDELNMKKMLDIAINRAIINSSKGEYSFDVVVELKEYADVHSSFISKYFTTSNLSNSYSLKLIEHEGK